MRINVLMVLNRVWSIDSPYNAAVCVSLCAPSAPATTLNVSPEGFGSPNMPAVMKPTSFRKYGKSISAHITPNTLNTVWASAARFAEGFPTAAAMLAVIVVPMFSPSTIAHAMSNLIHPKFSIMIVRAIVALED